MFTSATATDGSVTLEWSTPDAPSASEGTPGGGFDNGSTVTRWEYQQIAPSATGVWIPIPGSHRGTTRHTITGLTNGQGYQFQVRAVNGGGNGTASDSSTVATPTTVPAAPTSLTGTAGNSEVVLTWNPVSTGSTGPDRANGYSTIENYGYEYSQKTGDGDYSPWSFIIGSEVSAFLTADPNTFTVEGLTNGATYQFKVRARNINGAGAAAEADPVTIATIPGRPRSLTAVPGNGQVALSWTANSDGGSPITSWEFRLTTAADFSTNPAWVTIPGSNADTTSYTVVSLNNNATYRFQVRARNVKGPGSIAQSGEVDPGMPPRRANGPNAHRSSEFRYFDLDAIRLRSAPSFRWPAQHWRFPDPPLRVLPEDRCRRLR